jgi:hypothetical protein
MPIDVADCHASATGRGIPDTGSEAGGRLPTGSVLFLLAAGRAATVDLEADLVVP